MWRRFLSLVYLGLLFLAFPLGALAGIGGFFGLAYLTSVIPVMAVGGAVILTVVTFWLSRRAVRGLFSQNHRLLQWVPGITAVFTLTIVGLAAAGLVFTPMDVTYVPIEPTEETRYWTLPTGSRLAYSLTPAEVSEDETVPGPPIVRLHGGPGAPESLQPTTADHMLAAAGFDVYRYHQVGAGLSNRLEDVTAYTVERHVADLEAIRHEIGAEQIILVGGSWGGTLAAHYMATHPHRVKKAVFSSPGAIWPPAFAQQAISDGPEQEIISEAATIRFAVVFALQQINPGAAHNLADDEEMSGFFQPLIGRIIASDVAGCDAEGAFIEPPANPQIPPGFSYYTNMMTAADLNRVADPRPALQPVQTPVLILRGECDRLRWEVANEYQEVLMNTTFLVVEGAGHSVAASPQYAELIYAFLTDESG